jgi:hypothetical protein
LIDAPFILSFRVRRADEAIVRKGTPTNPVRILTLAYNRFTLLNQPKITGIRSDPDAAGCF